MSRSSLTESVVWYLRDYDPDKDGDAVCFEDEDGEPEVMLSELLAKRHEFGKESLACGLRDVFEEGCYAIEPVPAVKRFVFSPVLREHVIHLREQVDWDDVADAILQTPATVATNQVTHDLIEVLKAFDADLYEDLDGCGFADLKDELANPAATIREFAEQLEWIVDELLSTHYAWKIVEDFNPLPMDRFVADYSYVTHIDWKVVAWNLLESRKALGVAA